MDIPKHAELVEQIDRFLEQHNFAPTRLGREATGEPNLVSSIRKGRQPNLDTLNRIARVMADYDAKASFPSPSSAEQGVIPLQEADDAPASEPVSATKTRENIRDGEGGHGLPFHPSSATCLETSARPRPSAASPASLAGEPA